MWYAAGMWPLLFGIVCAAQNTADDPRKGLEIVLPRPVDIEATEINNRGEVIGYEWKESKEQPGVIDQVPFLAQGQAMTYLPLLEGFTSTAPEAISDDGTVVGRVSKPALPGVFVMFRNQAFVWDAQKGIRGLGCLPGDNASLASGISRDGKRISGVSVGDGKVRVVVWNRDGDGWKIQEVGQKDATASSRIVISPNGELLASSDGGIPCLWTHRGDGTWEREAIGKLGEMVPRAINDEACIAGLRYRLDGTVAAIVWTRAKGFEELTLPAGYVRAEAHDVNNVGQVVGYLDGPHGSAVGPDAFIFEGGSLRIIKEGGKAFTMATAINDRGQVVGVVEEVEEDAEEATDTSPAAKDGKSQP